MSHHYLLVQTHYEYTSHLVQAIGPSIYEGVLSIYRDAVAMNQPRDELRIFQELLRNTPKWNRMIIEEETKRILKMASRGSLIPGLLTAVVRSSVLMLTNTPPERETTLGIDQNVTIERFVHTCYVEAARSFFNNPWLFCHHYDAPKLMANKREALLVVEDCVRRAIQAVLPMDAILNVYNAGPASPKATASPQMGGMEEEKKHQEIVQLSRMINKINKATEKPPASSTSMPPPLSIPATSMHTPEGKVSEAAEQPAAPSQPRPAAPEAKAPTQPDSDAPFDNMEKATIEQVYARPDSMPVTVGGATATTVGSGPATVPPSVVQKKNNFFANYYK